MNSHLFGSDFVITGALRESTLPVVITDHGDYRYVVESGMATEDEVERILQRADGFVYPSDANGKYLQKYVPAADVPQRKIYYGVRKELATSDFREEYNIPADAFVFGMTARGIPEKGWEVALHAFERCYSRTIQDIRLVFVGDSKYLQNLRKTVPPALTGMVIFAGYSAEPLKWARTFDVGLLPSWFAGESLPHAIVEHIAEGKPVIASNTGGIKEMMSNGNQIAGVLLPLNGQGRVDEAELANAMFRFLNNSSTQKTCSSVASSLSTRFNIAVTAKQYLEFFASVAERKQQTHGGK